MEPLARFEIRGPQEIPDCDLTRLPLRPVGEQVGGVERDGDCIAFRVAGWFEVLLTVEWDPGVRAGHRFAHTAIPDSHPLHSEAIDAGVLAALSGARQLLRGNAIFEPDGSLGSIALEVWQDSGDAVQVHHASLDIRVLLLDG
jgi:hypothetical protein